MEGLTKENCFNRLEELYPFGMTIFKEWIDSIKEQLDWKNTFSDKGINRPGIVDGKIVDYQVAKDFIELSLSNNKHFHFTGDIYEIKFTEAIKFHNLPFELQFGILCRFFSNQVQGENVSFPFDIYQSKITLEKMIKRIDGHIKSGGLDR